MGGELCPAYEVHAADALRTDQLGTATRAFLKAFWVNHASGTLRTREDRVPRHAAIPYVRLRNVQARHLAGAKFPEARDDYANHSSVLHLAYEYKGPALARD